MKIISTFLFIFILTNACLYSQPEIGTDTIYNDKQLRYNENLTIDTIDSDIELNNIIYDYYNNSRNQKPSEKILKLKNTNKQFDIGFSSYNKRYPFFDQYSSKILYNTNDSILTMLEVASLCAPIFCYSEDEPLIPSNDSSKAKFNDAPDAYPFEEKNSYTVYYDNWNEHFEIPIVHYQITNILKNSQSNGSPLILSTYKKNGKYFCDEEKSKLDLSKIKNFTINYTHYYLKDIGANPHDHDNEQVQIDVDVNEPEDRLSTEEKFELVLKKVTAKAHGLDWYDNIYEPDNRLLKLPIHIFVEEGKHASCPDVNGDGYYMPGYDVNKNINDAWGVRDVIGTESIISPEYQGWMTKIRKKQFQVFPMLPSSSPYYESLCIPIKERDTLFCLKITNKDSCSDLFFNSPFNTSTCYNDHNNLDFSNVVVKNSDGAVCKNLTSQEFYKFIIADHFDSTSTLYFYKRQHIVEKKVFAPYNPYYELRQMPKLEVFENHYNHLKDQYFKFVKHNIKRNLIKGMNDYMQNKYIKDRKEDLQTQYISAEKLLKDVKDYIVEDNLKIKEEYEPIIPNDFTKTLSMVYRYNEGHCFDISIPLLFLKNVEMPVIYGWIVNKLGFNFNKKVWFYNLQYSSSASRFIDPYISAGIQFSNHIKPEYIIEGGGKIRVKFKWSPFLMQAGVGFSYNLTTNIEQIKKISTVFEIGVGGF